MRQPTACAMVCTRRHVPWKRANTSSDCTIYCRARTSARAPQWQSAERHVPARAAASAPPTSVRPQSPPPTLRSHASASMPVAPAPPAACADSGTPSRAHVGVGTRSARRRRLRGTAAAAEFGRLALCGCRRGPPDARLAMRRAPEARAAIVSCVGACAVAGGAHCCSATRVRRPSSHTPPSSQHAAAGAHPSSPSARTADPAAAHAHRSRMSDGRRAQSCAPRCGCTRFVRPTRGNRKRVAGMQRASPVMC